MAFCAVKDMLRSELVVVHYDHSQPVTTVTLACDASPYGISAVLSYVTKDGVERPIAYALHTLSKLNRTTLNWKRKLLE